MLLAVFTRCKTVLSHVTCIGSQELEREHRTSFLCRALSTSLSETGTELTPGGSDNFNRTFSKS